MKKIISVLALICAFASASFAKDKLEVGEFEDWFDHIDSVKVKEIFNLNDYKTIYIMPFDESKVEWPEKDDNRYEALEKALKKVPTVVQERLQKRLKGMNIVVATADQNIEANALKLNIKYEELSMGSRALRAWVGFGAGGQRIEISGTVQDGNGKEFTWFKHKRVSTNAKSYEKCVEEEFVFFGEDIAWMLGKYKAK